MSFDQIAPSVATGLISGFFSAWLTYVLAFRRFRAEKWWERRADAFRDIILALHASKKFSDRNINYIKRHQEIPNEEYERLQKEAQDAHNEILRAIDLGRLILPAAALERLNRYLEEDNANEPESFLDYVINDWRIVNCCLIDMAEIARSDLRTDRGLFSRALNGCFVGRDRSKR